MLSFLNPLFLWALAALAIPLALHLFQRRRTVVTPFPTIHFLKLAQKQAASRVRFENILLWLLRSLLLALLALAFAMPVLRRSAAVGWLGAARRDIVIVIDTSYSMSYETGRGTVMETAREAAARLIASLAPSDRVCVYLAGDTPQPLIARPTTEHAAVLRAVRAVEWQPGSSAIDEAVALALLTLDQDADSRRDREIHVLTDGQALPWQGFAGATDAGGGAAAGEEGAVIKREHRDRIPLFALLGGAEMPENTWPDRLTVTPSLIMAGRTPALDVTLGRSGPARQTTLTVLVGEEERASRGLLADADAETTAEVALPGLAAGTWPAILRTAVDALPFDDEFLFLLHVRDKLPVLVVGQEEATKFLRVALDPGGDGETVTAVSGDALDTTDLADFEAVFLADAFPLPGQAVIKLENYVRAGGLLAIFPGDHAAPRHYAELAIIPAGVRGIPTVPVDDAARMIGRVSREDAIFRNFRFPRGAVPSLALKRVLTFEEPAEDASVVLTAGPGQPFLLTRPAGRGRVFQFAVAADRAWSTLPLTSFFVPVVHQILRHGAGTAQCPPYAPLGTDLEVAEYIPGFRAGDRLLSPSGREASVRDSGNLRMVIEPLTEPGLYTHVRGGGAPVPALAVNADRAESRLTPALPGEIDAWCGFRNFRAVRTPEELMAAVESLHSGSALAEPLLWLVLLLALTEWWYANHTLRRRPRLTDTLTIAASGKVGGTT